MRERPSATEVIHAGEGAPPGAPLTTPIYETTTFVFDSAAQVEEYNEGRSSRYLYSRYDNPTIVSVEKKLAVLERADAALVFSSGMGATLTTCLTLLQAGDEAVCSAATYGGTYHLLADLLSKFGVVPRFVTLDGLAEPERVLTDRTRLLWFESPINPTLRCVDIRAVAQACRARGVLSVIDNTFASPANQTPLTMGVDLVMESATKYLNGHSDVTAGMMAGSHALIGRLAATRRVAGTVLDPQPAYALGRGLKTLQLRIDRHNASALAVAARFDRDPRVKCVYYPGLASHPDHAIAARQMTGFGGMVCFDVEGGYAGAARVYDRLRLIKRAASLGGVESLCSLPVQTSHRGYTDEALAAAGVSAGMMRVSIGLEDPEDLIVDLDQALGA